jgi:hypothetical protein
MEKARQSEGAAMLILGQRVRTGREGDYRAWEKKILAAASRYPGYRDAEVKPPNNIQPDWVVIYKFDAVPNVQNWLNSATRQKLLDEASDIFDGPGTRQVISENNQISDPLVTVVVTNRVPDDQVDRLSGTGQFRFCSAHGHCDGLHILCFSGLPGEQVFPLFVANPRTVRLCRVCGRACSHRAGSACYRCSRKVPRRPIRQLPSEPRRRNLDFVHRAGGDAVHHFDCPMPRLASSAVWPGISASGAAAWSRTDPRASWTASVLIPGV